MIPTNDPKHNGASSLDVHQLEAVEYGLMELQKNSEIESESQLAVEVALFLLKSCDWDLFRETMSQPLAMAIWDDIEASEV